MGEYSVYCHTNKINNKKYIGITKQIPKNRWGVNGKNYKKSNPYFYNAIEKYGWDNFEHEILFCNLSKDDACQKEIELIKEFKTQQKEFGYNIMDGGTAPSIPQEIRDKMSKAMMGNKNGFGHSCSEEKKEKISKAQKGKKLSEEHKNNLRKPKSVTHPCTEEKRQNIIAAKKDKKPIVCVETEIIYESIHECGRQMGIEPTAICAVLNGRHKSTHGYHFEYYNNTINA